MNKVQVQIMRLPHAADLPLPSAHAAGFDLVAAITPPFSPMVIWPGERAAIPTGLVIALPPGFEGQIRPRPGLALRHGITVLNTPGTVNSDYRGEVQTILANFGREAFTVRHGTPIAMLVVAAVARADICEIDLLVEETEAAS